MSTTAERHTHRQAPDFEHTTVAGAMHAGVLSCPPETPLRIVAQMMSSHRVHGIVVFGDPKNYADERAWRIVSDLDVVRAATSEPAARTAGDTATSPLVTVAPGDPLRYAAAQMAEHGVTHVVVADPASDHPIGIVSTLDVATALAWGRGDTAS